MNKIVIIWKDNIKIGYCHTYQEADDICKKNKNYTWSFLNNYIKIVNKLKFMTIFDYL